MGSSPTLGDYFFPASLVHIRAIVGTAHRNMWLRPFSFYTSPMYSYIYIRVYNHIYRLNTNLRSLARPAAIDVHILNRTYYNWPVYMHRYHIIFVIYAPRKDAPTDHIHGEENFPVAINLSLWRNRLARSAVNRKVGGSSPPRDDSFFQYTTHSCLYILIKAWHGQ